MNAFLMMTTTWLAIGQAPAPAPAPAPAVPVVAASCGCGGGCCTGCSDPCGCDSFGLNLREHMRGLFARNACCAPAPPLPARPARPARRSILACNSAANASASCTNGTSRACLIAAAVARRRLPLAPARRSGSDLRSGLHQLRRSDADFRSGLHQLRRSSSDLRSGLQHLRFLRSDHSRTAPRSFPSK